MGASAWRAPCCWHHHLHHLLLLRQLLWVLMTCAACPGVPVQLHLPLAWEGHPGVPPGPLLLLPGPLLPPAGIIGKHHSVTGCRLLDGA